MCLSTNVGACRSLGLVWCRRKIPPAETTLAVPLVCFQGSNWPESGFQGSNEVPFD